MGKQWENEWITPQLLQPIHNLALDEAPKRKPKFIPELIVG